MENMTQKFAKAIYSRRKQLGLTQEEVAKRVGTSKQMVSKYELAQRSPKVAMANAFAAALETTLDDLLGIQAEETEFWHEPDEPEIRIVSGVMGRMTQDQRKQVVAVIHAMFANNPELFEEKG